MTEPDQKFEEELRRALCAASDLVVPAGDGLNKIRERTARRPPALGWFLAYVAHLPRQLARGARVAASEVAATTHGYSSLGLVLASARRWPGQARHVLRTPGVWLRPLLASATALLLVVAVTLSIPRLRHQVTAQLDSAFGHSSGQGSNGGPGGAGAGVARSNSGTPYPSVTPTHLFGKPFLATMPPGSTQCRDQDSSGTVAARTYAGAANFAGAVGPQPVSVTCSASPAPAKQATSPPSVSPPVTTAPGTTPPVATTPPTTTSPPVTTSPPTTPPVTTSPPTSPPTQTSTSSTNNPANTGVPTESAAPGN